MKTAEPQRFSAYNEDAAAGATNTLRRLTHSLDYGKEGLGMKSSHHETTGRSDWFDSMDAAAVRSFWAKVDKTPTCWLWTAHVGGHGYGTFSLWRAPNRWTLRAHRVSYMIANGRIDDGLVIDHICRVTECVNPAHLRATTVRGNTLAGIGISAINARKTHCQNGHEFTPENTYTHPTKGSRECRICRREDNRWRKAAKRAARAAIKGES